MPFDGRTLPGSLSTNPQVQPRPRWFTRLRSKSPRSRKPTPFEVNLGILTVARSLIADEKDWVQGRYETIDGRRCAVGALRIAARLEGFSNPPEDSTAPLLRIAHVRGFETIEKMNDRSTHDQVVSAFDTAIASIQPFLIAGS